MLLRLQAGRPPLAGQFLPSDQNSLVKVKVALVSLIDFLASFGFLRLGATCMCLLQGRFSNNPLIAYLLGLAAQQENHPAHFRQEVTSLGPQGPFQLGIGMGVGGGRGGEGGGKGGERGGKGRSLTLGSCTSGKWLVSQVTTHLRRLTAKAFVGYSHGCCPLSEYPALSSMQCVRVLVEAVAHVHVISAVRSAFSGGPAAGPSCGRLFRPSSLCFWSRASSGMKRR